MYSWHPRKPAITVQKNKKFQVPWKPTAKIIKSSWNNNIFPRVLGRPVNNRSPEESPMFAGYRSHPWGPYIMSWCLSPGQSTAACNFLWSLPGPFLKWPHSCRGANWLLYYVRWLLWTSGALHGTWSSLPASSFSPWDTSISSLP